MSGTSKRLLELPTQTQQCGLRKSSPSPAPDLGLHHCVPFRNPLTHRSPWGRAKQGLLVLPAQELQGRSSESPARSDAAVAPAKAGSGPRKNQAWLRPDTACNLNPRLGGRGGATQGKAGPARVWEDRGGGKKRKTKKSPKKRRRKPCQKHPEDRRDPDGNSEQGAKGHTSGSLAAPASALLECAGAQTRRSGFERRWEVSAR